VVDGGRAAAIPNRYGVTRDGKSCNPRLLMTRNRGSRLFPAGHRKGLKRDLSDFHHSNAFGVLLDRSIAALIASRRTQRHKPFMVYPPE